MGEGNIQTPSSEPRPYVFVDERHNVLTGPEAEAALKRVSDVAYVEPGCGIVRVPRKRWQIAQAFEKTFWMVRGTDARDDRNHDHERGFQGYAMLRGEVFDQAIELGCGPFTNLRLIAGGCTIRRCTLLDPLIEDYLCHPHCSYDRQWLRLESRLGRRLSTLRVLRAIRRMIQWCGPSLLVSRIPIIELLPTTIEDMDRSGRYDLVVLINVIEHCFDVAAVFGAVLEILKPGGILVFHDKYYDRNALTAVRCYDAGHPLRPDRGYIDQFLQAGFDPLFRAEGRQRHRVEGLEIESGVIYFVGRRTK